jgi:hypothetical protein
VAVVVLDKRVVMVDLVDLVMVEMDIKIIF